MSIGRGPVGRGGRDDINYLATLRIAVEVLLTATEKPQVSPIDER